MLAESVLTDTRPRVALPDLRRALLQAQLLAAADEWKDGKLPWRLPFDALEKRAPAAAAALKKTLGDAPAGGLITLDTPIPVDQLIAIARALALPCTALIAQVERDPRG